MRVSFIATESAFISESDALICGVTDGTHYLTFQRAISDSVDDWGVHLEYNDQRNSCYNCISQCRWTSKQLSVDLLLPLGGLRGTSGFDVIFNLNSDQSALVKTGLSQIFRGHDELLLFLND